jgi:hypothetical protein
MLNLLNYVLIQCGPNYSELIRLLGVSEVGSFAIRNWSTTIPNLKEQIINFFRFQVTFYRGQPSPSQFIQNNNNNNPLAMLPQWLPELFGLLLREFQQEKKKNRVSWKEDKTKNIPTLDSHGRAFVELSAEIFIIVIIFFSCLSFFFLQGQTTWSEYSRNFFGRRRF